MGRVVRKPKRGRARAGIGTLGEMSLHAALKEWYAKPGDVFEARVDGYVIDILRGELIIEIQTRNLGALKSKLTKLVETHSVRLVHPIAEESWIRRIAADGETLISRRKSRRRGTVWKILDELIFIPKLLAHPNLTLQILLVHEDEVRLELEPGTRPRGMRRVSRWHRGWAVHDRRLIRVVESRLIESPADLLAFLPLALSRPFSNRELAEALHKPYAVAQKLSYILRESGMLLLAGKRGSSLLYDFVRAKTDAEQQGT